MAEQVDDCIKFKIKKVIILTGSFLQSLDLFGLYCSYFVDIESRNPWKLSEYHPSEVRKII